MRNAFTWSLLVFALITAMPASGAGLSYAVSFDKAKDIIRTDNSKHILVFYTESW